ncbi:MAG: PQQ-dependent sugar dehydrogenase, partial [Dehalococcoidia bacterium]
MARDTTCESPGAVSQRFPQRRHYGTLIHMRRIVLATLAVVLLLGATQGQRSAQGGPNISVTIDTSEAGLRVVVDDVVHDAPFVIVTAPSTPHTIYTPSPQTTPDGRTVVFGDWSDTLAQEHQITPISTGTITANFNVMRNPFPPFQNGFEEGNLSSYDNVDIAAGNTLGVTATHPNTGTYSLEVSTGGVAQPAVVDRLFDNLNTIYLRTFLSLPVGFTLDPAAVQHLMVFKTDDFRDRLWVTIGDDYRLSPVYFHAGGGVPTFPGPVGPVIPRDGSWHEVEVRETIDDTHGQVELWLDGARIAWFSEVDTGIAGTDDIGVVSWGSYFSTATKTTTTFFDDATINDTYISGPPDTGWQAQYYNNITLTGPPVLTRTESPVDHDWALGSPDPAVNADNFSARWTRTIQPPSGTYRFITTTDDGVRLYLDGNLIIDQWIDQAGASHNAVRTLDGGPHNLKMEYYEHLGGALARLKVETVTSQSEGFVTDVIADGLFLPTTFTFVPDGRIFIGQKDGSIWVYKNGDLLDTPLVTIPNVNTYQDRGLLSIVVDPNFATNGFLYAAYTHDVNPGAFTGAKTARLIRLTVVGDQASMASQQIILGSVVGDALHPSCDDFVLGADCIPSDGRTHTIGGMQFLADGTLLLTTGEGADDMTVNDQALRAQQLDSLGGKMLRINTNGTGIASNPFYTGNANDNRSKVYATGFRNSFRFGLRPGTQVPYTGDVGWGSWEEINVILPGANYGWPCYEGNEFLIAYSIYQTCTDLQTAGTATPPLYTYPHPPSSAAVGGAFYQGTAYPAEYQGAYFWGDYARNEISTLRVDAGNNLVPDSVQQFTDQGAGPVQISSGPDTNIYYLAINSGELRRIRYVVGNRPPIVAATATPFNGLLPLNVQFSSAGTYDPEGGILTYDWAFGDGAVSSAPNPAHQYTIAGTYNAVLTVTDDQAVITTKTISIYAGNSAPQPTIVTPTAGMHYSVGDLISYSGTAVDTQDGILPASAFSWTIVLHHCDIVTSTCHVHPFLYGQGRNGSFTVPDHGQGVSFELILSV